MIISLKEARKIMGKDADKLSDEELEKLIDQLSSLARSHIQSVQRGEFDSEALAHSFKEKERKEHALALASLIYDIYQDKKRKEGSI